MSKIKIFSLGGRNESGKNMYVVSVDEEIFIFDAGLKYPIDRVFGIDYIIPAYDFLKKNIKKIRGIFLTHGHEEHIGAIADIVSNFPKIKVYATKFTCEMLKLDFQEYDIKFENLIEIKAHTKLKFGKNSIFPISLTHSTPDSVGYVLNTLDGAIFYTGNYVFDSSMHDPYKTDIGKLAYIGKQGVLCLMSESFYADKEGHTSPKNRISSFIKSNLSKYKNRIVISVLTSHIYRLKELFDVLKNTNRKIIIMGKTFQNFIKFCIDNNYINIDASRFGDLSDINNDNAVIIVSDDRFKPFNSIQKILHGYDKFIKLNNKDTVILLEQIYDNMENSVIKVADDIAKIGCNVVTLSNKTHMSYHASREDIMLMLNLMNPKYYMPVIGDYKNMVENANVASDYGISASDIILKLNGEVSLFEKGELKECNEIIPIDEILIDGKSSEDVGELVIKDREVLSDNGIVIVSATLDRRTKKLAADPVVISRGFIYVKENADIIEECKNISLEIINDSISDTYVDYSKIRNSIREKLNKYLYKETECRPMVITIIQEV